jgi:hypothetical protein
MSCAKMWACATQNRQPAAPAADCRTRTHPLTAWWRLDRHQAVNRGRSQRPLSYIEGSLRRSVKRATAPSVKNQPVPSNVKRQKSELLRLKRPRARVVGCGGDGLGCCRSSRALFSLWGGCSRWCLRSVNRATDRFWYREKAARVVSFRNLPDHRPGMVCEGRVCVCVRAGQPASQPASQPARYVCCQARNPPGMRQQSAQSPKRAPGFQLSGTYAPPLLDLGDCGSSHPCDSS